MAQAYGQKSSADLEREVNEQRSRVETRIGEIRERLSPGQLVDEVLSYTKDGGGKFAANLGQQITANPLPTALVAVGLAWLIGSNVTGGAVPQPRFGTAYSGAGDDSFARATDAGLKRIGHTSDDSGQWWSEFQSESGAKYKAASDSLGRRAGQFTDETGRSFSGFVDDAGNRVRQFLDESGNVLDDAMGWASSSWQGVQRGLGEHAQGVADTAAQVGSNVASGARRLADNVGGTVQSQADQLTRGVSNLFNQQPLVVGALAFAAGAALGATLPHTEQEDQLLGEHADKLRRQAAEAAGQMYREGKEQATEVYGQVTDKAGRLYEETKQKVADLGAAPSDNVH